jgi:hypothetical protein
VALVPDTKATFGRRLEACRSLSLLSWTCLAVSRFETAAAGDRGANTSRRV